MEGLKSKWKRLVNRHRLIGYVGVVGSGKDHNANKLVYEKGFIRYSFADPLRLLLSMVFGKEVIYEKYNKFKHSTIIVGVFWKVLSGRDILQKLGDGIRTVFGEDIFIDVMDRKIEFVPQSVPGIVIPDVRYMNEAEYILQMGGELIFCNYISDRYDCTLKHKSEQLAQTFVAMGFSDGEKITIDDLRTANNLIKELKINEDQKK